MRKYNLKPNNPVLAFMLFSIFVFILSQLIINSVLTPLGIELQNLNSEKNYLLEENRGMEEEVAKTNSITVIQKLANKSLNIYSKAKKNVIYIEDQSIIADRQ